MIGKQLKILRESHKKSQLEVCAALNIEQSTLANYENDKRIPKIDILIKIAEYYKVPIDYLLGIGIFENWDILLKNKTSIIHLISVQAQQLFMNINDGVDDITFAKLVYAFDIHINIHDDGTIGLSAKDPIPTYTNSYLSNTQSLDEAEKKILSLYRTATLEEQNEIMNLLHSFCTLKNKARTIVLGKCYELEQNTQSVAANEKLKKTGTDSMGK